VKRSFLNTREAPEKEDWRKGISWAIIETGMRKFYSDGWRHLLERAGENTGRGRVPHREEERGNEEPANRAKKGTTKKKKNLLGEIRELGVQHKSLRDKKARSRKRGNESDAERESHN